MSDHNHDSVEPSYLVAKKGILSWLITVDHKRIGLMYLCLLYTSPSPRDKRQSRMPSSA